MMRALKLGLLGFVAVCLILHQRAFAETSLTAKSFEGVWKVSKVVKADLVAPKDPAHPTDSEKSALYDEWAGYAASAGTYEVKGNAMINHNIVAKMVRGMALTEEAIISGFDGNNFVAKPAPGSPNSDRETTYTRVR